MMNFSQLQQLMSLEPQMLMTTGNNRQNIIFPDDNLNSNELTEYLLEPEEELRVVVGEKETIKIVIESGQVEIEGAELPLRFPVSFTNKMFAIFCWKESKVKIYGNNQNIYKATQTPNVQYLMAHQLISEMRSEALLANIIGPKVLVTGSSNSGKTTLCHILLNYSLKLGSTPVYVDLDLSNEIAVPGTIAASVIDFTLPNEFLIDNAVMLYHGRMGADTNYALYEKQISEMANLVCGKLNYDLNLFKEKYMLANYNNNNNNKFIEKELNPNNSLNTNPNIYVHKENPTLFASGAIINCPTIKDHSKEYIYKTVINEFNCNMILVLENEKLYNDLLKSYQGSNIEICLISKSGGVVSMDSNYKEQIEQKRFDSYFKGPFNNLRLNEFTLELNVYRLIEVIQSNVTSALLPIGITSDMNLLLKEVNYFEENLLNRVIAVPHLDESVINDLDTNFDKRLNNYIDVFARAPVMYLAFM